MTIYFSPSKIAFYDTDLPTPIPNDAVEISPEIYQELLNGQSDGKTISTDEKGLPKLVELHSPTSLNEIKTNAARQIDVAAEAERMKYITAGQGQAMTYQQKVEEAKAYQAATSPKGSDYPMLNAEVGITAPTLKKVVEIILVAFTQWQIIGAAIEGIRLKAKKDIDLAKDEAAVRAVVEAIKWP